jgi:mannose-6-phosphate isomerase-like protein (cupin superfamily)
VVRRVVTGHDDRGRSRVVSDDEAGAVKSGGPESVLFHIVWGRDDVAQFPDAGVQPGWSGPFPPPGGCRCVVFELPPGAADELDLYVAQGLEEFADHSRPGMHRSPTTDFDIVLNGTVGLELDEDEVVLQPGDVVVLNGTFHRWHNRGSITATIAAVTIGAYHSAFPVPST